MISGKTCQVLFRCAWCAAICCQSITATARHLQPVCWRNRRCPRMSMLTNADTTQGRNDAFSLPSASRMAYKCSLAECLEQLHLLRIDIEAWPMHERPLTARVLDREYCWRGVHCCKVSCSGTEVRRLSLCRIKASLRSYCYDRSGTMNTATCSACSSSLTIRRQSKSLPVQEPTVCQCSIQPCRLCINSLR